MDLIDVIIISHAKNDEFKKLTERCIKSLRDSETDFVFNVIIVESNKEVIYPNVITYHYKGEFNYNKACNRGYQFTTGDYVGFFNNDIEFQPGWCTQLLKYECDSASPICMLTHRMVKYHGKIKPIFGYRIGQELAGWAIVMKRTTYEAIQGFDEDIAFWASDDAYAQQLQALDIKHFLIPRSKVNHLNGGSNTLNTLNTDEKLHLTYEQARIFNKKYHKNLFNLN